MISSCRGFLDKKAVLGLPFRMMVSIIIGGAVLSSLLYYLNSSCVFPQELEVRWNPSFIENYKKSNIHVYVMADGKPVSGAMVLISGLGNASFNFTNGEGMAEIQITPHMKYEGENYLSVMVKAGECYRKFYVERAIRVIPGEK